MKGYFCNKCECRLNDSDFASPESKSYSCHTCGFTYRHGASPVQDQVDKFNEEQGEEDDSYGYAEQKNFD
jgi:hypothetical protein